MNTLERLKLTNLLKKTVDERNAETNTLKRLKLANQVQQLRKQLGLIVAVEQNEPLTPQQNIEQSDEQAQLNRLTQIALKSKTRQELNEQFGLSEKALDYFQSGYDFFIENFNDGTYYYIDGENWQEVVKTEKQRLANAGIAIPTIQELLGDVDYLTKEYWQERLVSTVSFIKKVRDNISSNRKAYLHLSELGREMAKQELALKNPELSFVAMVNYGSELRKIKTDNQNSNTVATEQESQSNNTFNTKIIKGRKNSVKTAKGTKIDTVFALVDGKYVIAGHTETGAENPKYDQSLQPRDRSRESSIAWVSKTANNLDPESLGRTGRADTGAPIIGDDMMVESGNGRTMAIKLAYKNGKAEEYRQWLIDEADMFGFTEAQVSQFKEPILVRIRTSEIDRATFAIEANQDDKLSLSATERAKADAKRLDDNLMALFNPSDDGDLMANSNLPFIRGFLAKLGDTEASQYSDSNGKPTQALIARIKASIFAKAYDDDRLLEMMADVANPELQNMLNALSKSAPKFIEARVTAKGDTQDLSEKLVDGIELALDQKLKNAIIDASNLILQAKHNNQALSEYVKQQGLFGDVEPEVVDLALFMAKNARSAKKMTEYFSAMAEYVAQDNLNRQNESLFGEPESLKLSDVMAFANHKLGLDVENGDLFSQENNTSKNNEQVIEQQENEIPKAIPISFNLHDEFEKIVDNGDGYILAELTADDEFLKNYDFKKQLPFAEQRKVKEGSYILKTFPYLAQGVDDDKHKYTFAGALSTAKKLVKEFKNSNILNNPHKDKTWQGVKGQGRIIASEYGGYLAYYEPSKEMVSIYDDVDEYIAQDNPEAQLAKQQAEQEKARLAEIQKAEAESKRKAEQAEFERQRKERERLAEKQAEILAEKAELIEDEVMPAFEDAVFYDDKSMNKYKYKAVMKLAEQSYEAKQLGFENNKGFIEHLAKQGYEFVKENEYSDDYVPMEYRSKFERRGGNYGSITSHYFAKLDDKSYEISEAEYHYGWHILGKIRRGELTMNEQQNPNYTQSDIDYLQSIISGTLDLETVDMDKMIEIGEKDEHDPMYEQALQIISDYEDEMTKDI